MNKTMMAGILELAVFALPLRPDGDASTRSAQHLHGLSPLPVHVI